MLAAFFPLQNGIFQVSGPEMKLNTQHFEAIVPFGIKFHLGNLFSTFQYEFFAVYDRYLMNVY